MTQMTDLRPPTPLLPDTAPFTRAQRAWLNGFFAGLLATDQAPPPATPPASEPDDGAPWHDPALAIDERMRLAQGRPLDRRMMAAMAQQDCGQCGYTCEVYAKAIAEQAEDRLGLCAPGGKATARMLKSLIEETGASASDPETLAAKAKAKAAETARRADKSPGYSRENPVWARFLGCRKLNGEGSGKATYHIEFALPEHGLDYAPGDSFGVFVKNDPALADAVIAALHAPADFPVAAKTLRAALIEDFALETAPDILFELISYLTGGDRRAKARALAKGADPDGDAATLDVLAALEKFDGIRPDPEAVLECLEPLRPRLYSIASSPKAQPGKLALTVDRVAYDIAGRHRLGVASTFLADRAAEGETLPVFIQRAHKFALPANPATAIIMVGPGTGVAPFRAFLQERHATNAAGPAWLFFGHQRRADFLYREEIEAFQAAGTLTNLSLAWSREGAEKVHVQHRMREQAGELWTWLRNGAHFYVCGDAKRMAANVEQTLIAIAAREGDLTDAAATAYVRELKANDRYQTDVY